MHVAVNPEDGPPGPGFEISAKFRRNSPKNFVFVCYREKKFRYFSENFGSKFKIQKILD